MLLKPVLSSFSFGRSAPISTDDAIMAKAIVETQRSMAVPFQGVLRKTERGGTRTLDLRIKSPLLYQLSYALESRFTFSGVPSGGREAPDVLVETPRGCNPWASDDAFRGLTPPAQKRT